MPPVDPQANVETNSEAGATPVPETDLDQTTPNPPLTSTKTPRTSAENAPFALESPPTPPPNTPRKPTP